MSDLPLTNVFAEYERLSRFPITNEGARAFLRALELDLGVQHTSDLLRHFLQISSNQSEEQKVNILQKYMQSMSLAPIPSNHFQNMRANNLRNNLAKPLLRPNSAIETKVRDQVAQQQAQATGSANTGIFASSGPKSSSETEFRSHLTANTTAGFPELENELSLVEVMTTFYQKYTILFCDLDEDEKARTMKVQLKRKDGTFIALTRNELDQQATNYRKALQSFSQVSGHLTSDTRSKISENLDFWTFISPPQTAQKASPQSLFPQTMVALLRMLCPTPVPSEEEMYAVLAAKHTELLSLWTKLKPK